MKGMGYSDKFHWMVWFSYPRTGQFAYPCNSLDEANEIVAQQVASGATNIRIYPPTGEWHYHE